MGVLQFRVVWRDKDDLIELEVRASNSLYSATHKTYVYPEQLLLFGEELQAFPFNGDTDVVLETGSREPSCSDHMRLRAHKLSPLGKSVMEVEFQSRVDPPASAMVHFFLTGAPASFAQLGADVCHFVESGADELRSEWLAV